MNFTLKNKVKLKLVFPCSCLTNNKYKLDLKKEVSRYDQSSVKFWRTNYFSCRLK